MPIENIIHQRLMTVIAVIFVTCLVCMGGALGSVITKPGTENHPVTNRSLADTGWQLVSYERGDAQIPVVSGSKITLNFNTDGSIDGSGGINHYFGSYTQNGLLITFGTVGCTEMAGPEPLMDQESAYFRLLDSVRSSRTVGSTLELQEASGRVVLTFQSDNNGGNIHSPTGKDPETALPGTEWQLSSYTYGNTGVSGPDINVVTLKFDDTGNLNGYSGVNTYSGSYHLVGAKISIGPLATTKMAGPEPRMGLESVYLYLLGSITGASLTGDSLSLTDNNGNVVLVFGQKSIPSQDRFSAFFSPATSHTTVSPGAGQALPTAFIEGFSHTHMISSVNGGFFADLVQPVRATSTIPTTGNLQSPSLIPRYNDSVIPPMTYPGRPYY